MSKIVLSVGLVDDILSLYRLEQGDGSAEEIAECYPAIAKLAQLNIAAIEAKEDAVIRGRKEAHALLMADWDANGRNGPPPDRDHGHISLSLAEIVLPEGWEIIPDAAAENEGA